LGRLLRKRLMAVKRGRRFIDYRQSREFAAELSGWLADVGDGLVETDPDAALGLLEEFIGSDGRILGRVDDSNGLIGDAFRLACGMWHRAASKLPASPDWVKRVYDLHADNDYGVRDALLDEAALRLSELELRRLAKTYEEEAGTPPTRPDNSERDWQAHSAATSMGQVALALKDAALYEKSLRIRSPQLNTIQATKVAEKYVAFGPVEKAVSLLEFSQSDDRDLGQLDVLAEAYEKLGDSAKLRETRKRLFERSVSSRRVLSPRCGPRVIPSGPLSSYSKSATRSLPRASSRARAVASWMSTTPNCSDWPRASSRRISSSLQSFVTARCANKSWRKHAARPMAMPAATWPSWVH